MSVRLKYAQREKVADQIVSRLSEEDARKQLANSYIEMEHVLRGAKRCRDERNRARELCVDLLIEALELQENNFHSLLLISKYDAVRKWCKVQIGEYCKVTITKIARVQVSREDFYQRMYRWRHACLSACKRLEHYRAGDKHWCVEYRHMTDDRDRLRAELDALRERRCETCRHYVTEIVFDGNTDVEHRSCGYHDQFFDEERGCTYARGWSKNWYCADWRGKGGE